MSSSNIRTIPGWEAMTGEQLYAFSLAHPNTAKAVRSADLQKWLRLNRLSWFDLDGKWVGLLADIARNPATPADKRGQMEGLLSQFREDPSAPIETDSDEYAGLLAWLLSEIEMPAEEIGKFYELGQGRKYPLFASVSQAELVRDLAITQDLRREALNAIIDRANAAVSEASSAYDSGATADVITAAAEAAWSGN